MKYFIFLLFCLSPIAYSFDMELPIDEVGRTMANGDVNTISEESSLGELFKDFERSSKGVGVSLSFGEVGSRGFTSNIEEKSGASAVHNFRREVGVVVPVSRDISVVPSYINSNVRYLKSDNRGNDYFKGSADGVLFALAHDFHFPANFSLKTKAAAFFISGNLDLQKSDNTLVPASYSYGQYGINLSTGPQYRHNRLIWGLSANIGQEWVEMSNIYGTEGTRDVFTSFGGSINLGWVL